MVVLGQSKLNICKANSRTPLHSYPLGKNVSNISLSLLVIDIISIIHSLYDCTCPVQTKYLISVSQIQLNSYNTRNFEVKYILFIANLMCSY